MKAIIIGAGIGGLTTALCLNHFGISVDIIEQSPELDEVGAGIQLSPNAMKVFEKIGIADDLSQIAFQPEAIEIRMGESGKSLIRSPLSGYAEKRYGSPYLHVHRADLIAVLERSVKERISCEVCLGSTFERYTHNEEGVSVELSDAHKISADVLIGADGIHSKTREIMLGSDAPVFTGNVAWRTVVPIERLGADIPPPVACAWLGRGRHAVTYLLRQGRLANLVAVVEQEEWTKESWREEGSREEALADFKNWHPIITSLISESEQLYRWPLFDRAPLPKWTDGCVAILGDAAHPMLPFMAQGAAMAIEDAWAISAIIANSHNIPNALQDFQKIRLPRTTKLQALSRQNAKTFHQRTKLGRLKNYGPIWLAGRIAPVIGTMRQDSIYGYNIVSMLG